MCTPRQRNVQLPLRPRTLLITDVTRLQPFTVSGDNFRESIETLINYNVHIDWIQQDCLYIEQGHLMTQLCSRLIQWRGSPPNSSCNMDTYKEVLYAPGFPALISTGITLLYLLLKAYQFAVYALPHQTERRLAGTTPGGRHQVHSSIAGDKGCQEVLEQIPRNISAEYGAEFQQPSGTVPLSRGWENICITARRNDEEHSVEPVIRKDAKRLQSRGSRIPKTIMAKDPVAHMMTPQEYLTKVAAGQMPRMNNHEMMVELAAKNDQNTTTHDGVSGRSNPEKQVSDVSLQTDTCDTLYVTKNTLTAYTIAIVQNSQAFAV